MNARADTIAVTMDDEICAQEPIHLPGAIQPHGALLAIDAASLRITHASANIEAFLGRPVEEVLGRNIETALGDAARHLLSSVELHEGRAVTGLTSLRAPDGTPLHLRAFRVHAHIGIDIEPVRIAPDRQPPVSMVQSVLETFQHAALHSELCDLAVRGLRTITGYDRVMAYRFNGDGHGEVIAEALKPGLEPYLGLHYPASDIPAQARQHYLRQPVGVVSDAAYEPVALLRAPADQDGDQEGDQDEEPLDLTHSTLRSVSPLHRRYMQNMGTAASLTVGLVQQQRLWGMLVCHHTEPRVAGHELMAASGMIGQVVSLLLGSIGEAQLFAQHLDRNKSLHALVARLSAPAALADQTLEMEWDLLHLVKATGGIARLAGRLVSFGDTPPRPAAERALAVFEAASGGELVSCCDVGLRYSGLSGCTGAGSGALFLPLAPETGDAILWFRPEAAQTVSWGGDPANHACVDPGSGLISPRTSFAAWTEIVKGRSAPWDTVDLEMATSLQSMVVAKVEQRARAEALAARIALEGHAQDLEEANAQLERLTAHLRDSRDVADNANRAKSRFLASMSHELRTPLNGILGYAKLLQLDEGLGDAQRARVNAMVEAGQHLLLMISCVLDLAEIEAEHVRLRLAKLDAQEVAAACLNLVRPPAEAKRLSLRMVTALPEPLPPVVTDPTRLRQVLLNLLGNAVKFTARGAVELRLHAMEDGTAVRFEVADTGPGIPPEQRLHLFHEFSRLSTDETRMSEGAGLGLALSARLAALLGGELGHEDNPGGGSVFWLQLPLRTMAESLAATALPLDILGQAAHSGEAAKHPLKILVADDVAMNRDVAASFLRAAGHDVATVDGGEQAVAAAEAADFDVVLMDVRMPGVDGLEATRRIRALPGSRGLVPVVALTAQVFAEQVEHCRQAGMDGHLAKPFDPDSLFEAVARAGRAARSPESAAGFDEAVPDKAAHLAGEDLPIFDHAAFRVTSSFVSSDVIQVHVQSIAERCESVLAGLAELGNPVLLTQRNNALADTVHRLSGSGGLFGFERIAVLGQHCEQALRSGSGDLHAIAAALARALEATLATIRQNLLLSPAPETTNRP